MKYNRLGRSELMVSEFCFGTLPMGPLQLNMPVEEGADLLVEAMENGVTFFDTAQLYCSYPYLRRAMQRYGKEVIIASKSVASAYEDMSAAIEEALRELGRDWVDIFHLHAARADADLFQQRAGALECLADYKRKGYIRAIGISVHDSHILQLAVDQPQIDVTFPIYNRSGIGMIHSSPEQMLAAARASAAAGQGVYSMKLLGGGTLTQDVPGCIAFGRREPSFAAHAVGVVSQAELRADLKIFNDQPISEEEIQSLARKKRILITMNNCKKCGACAKACPNFAIEMSSGTPTVNEEKCLTCGYCIPACGEFAIRMI